MTTRALRDAGGTITEGGTAQTVLGANESRLYLLIQNPSDKSMWVNFGDDAADDETSILLPSLATLCFEGAFVPSDAVSIYCDTTGKAFAIKHG